MSVSAERELQSAALRLRALSESGHPARLRAFDAALFARRALEGTPVPTLLSEAGAPVSLQGYLASFQPDRLPAAIDAAASAIGRSERRRKRLRAVGLYPLLCALIGLVLLLLQFEVALPALARLAALEHRHTLAAWPFVLAGALSTAALLLLAAFIGVEKIRIAFPAFRRADERALFLSLVAGASAQGANPEVSLRSAAAALPPGSRQLAEDWARTLGRGETAKGGEALLSPIEAGGLRTAAARGAFTPVTVALAELAELRAEQRTPFAVLTAEAVTLLCFAPSLLAAGAAFFSAYGRALVLS